MDTQEPMMSEGDQGADAAGDEAGEGPEDDVDENAQFEITVDAGRLQPPLQGELRDGCHRTATFPHLRLNKVNEHKQVARARERAGHRGQLRDLYINGLASLPQDLPGDGLPPEPNWDEGKYARGSVVDAGGGRRSSSYSTRSSIHILRQTGLGHLECARGARLRLAQLCCSNSSHYSLMSIELIRDRAVFTTGHRRHA